MLFFKRTKWNSLKEQLQLHSTYLGQTDSKSCFILKGMKCNNNLGIIMVQNAQAQVRDNRFLSTFYTGRLCQ